MSQRYGDLKPPSVTLRAFHARFGQNGETVRHYARVLLEMIETAFPGQTNDAVRFMLSNQFVRGLGNRECADYLQLNVDFAHPTSWQTLIEKAELFENVRGSSFQIRKPQPFHDIASRPLPEPHVPFVPRSTYRPHPVAQQNSLNTEAFVRPPSTQAPVCFQCKGQGHFSRDCPVRTRQNDIAGN